MPKPCSSLGPLLLLAAAGCANVSPERGHDQVAALVAERTGLATRWEHGPPDDARIAAWIQQALQGGLTRRLAVEIALVNNPELQATYEGLGVSQADMVQAGLLRNPTVGADLGFSTSSGQLSETRFALVQDFLDLFILPLRKRIAAEQFEADTLRVAHQTLEVAAEVEKAVAAALTSAELVALRRTLVELAGAAEELADAQLEAGNNTELELAVERAAAVETRLALMRDELELAEARERLARLLGLGADGWTFKETLPALPPADPAPAELEAVALDRRLDVAASRRQAALLDEALKLARTTRLFGRIEVGVDWHRDPDGPRVFGPNLIIDLPLFDRRQAYIARLEAQRREQERRLAGLKLTVRSEVRLASGRLAAARWSAVKHRDELLPLRTQITEQTQLRYNGMLAGLPQLLAAKQAEVEARRASLEALRDYWIARAELARAVGGGLPAPPSPPRKENQHVE